MGEITDAYLALDHGVLKIPQRLKDVTIENAMRDPGLEAIFANADPDDYLDQILHLCYHRGCVISRIEDELKIK